MSNNIFYRLNVIKVVLFYTNATSMKKRVIVSPKDADGKHLFFLGDAQFGVIKPKKNSSTDVYMYTPTGIYKSTVNLVDTISDLYGTLYKLEAPKTWNCLQFRTSPRKNAELVGILKLNDESEIEVEVCNLSETGFAFWTDEPISALNQRFPCIAALEFPGNQDQTDKVLLTEASFVRTQEGSDVRFDQQLYGLKFAQLAPDEQINLRNYLAKLK